MVLGLVALVGGLAFRAIAAEVTHQSAVPQAEIPKYIVDAVNSPDRPAADKARDASRKPEQMMAFFGIKPGMKVADLWAAGGYTTELLARIVGPTGKVYSQNIAFPAKFKDAEKAWKARTSEPGLSNVVEVTKPFDSPDVLPVPPGSLDAVLINLNYHDLVARGFDRSKLNAAVFKALKPGGESMERSIIARSPGPARGTPTHFIGSTSNTRSRRSRRRDSGWLLTRMSFAIPRMIARNPSGR